MAPAESSKGAKGSVVAAVGNFSIQYNFHSASIALQVISTNLYLGYPLYTKPGWADELILAAAFIGAMLGMVSMGRLGDVLGRSKAMCVTTALCGLGAIIPACGAGSPESVYGVVIAGRLVLGIGAGGIYPLSAVTSAEGGSGAEGGRSGRVGWAFFWQTPGVLVPYLLAMLMFGLVKPEPPQTWVPQVEFRVLLALGCLPALVVFLAAFNQRESEEFRGEAEPGDGRGGRGLWSALMAEPRETRWTLLGTASTWFFFDVAYYGINIFTPTIIRGICLTGTKVGGRCDQTLFQTAWQSLLVQSMGIPGCLLAVSLVDRLGCRRLNTYGLLWAGLDFGAMVLVFAVRPAWLRVKFILFCCLIVLLYLPAVGTYVLPAICFPPHVRSTCHGLSAFGGKLGAVVGTLIFPVVTRLLGIPAMMAIQVVVCAVGALAADRLLKHDWEYSTREGKLSPATSYNSF